MCWSKRCWCCPSGPRVVTSYGDPVNTVAEGLQAATAHTGASRTHSRQISRARYTHASTTSYRSATGSILVERSTMPTCGVCSAHDEPLTWRLTRPSVGTLQDGTVHDRTKPKDLEEE
jgi:hypothetical protein